MHLWIVMNGKIIQRIVTGLILGILFWLSFIYLPSIYFSFILLGILLQIILVEWKNLFNSKNPIFWLLMPFYPIFPFILLILMNHHPLYRKLLFILFILVSSHDTGSYIIGNLIGKHKIYPLISPSKTWEGFIGGYIFACIGLTLLLWEFNIAKSFGFIAFFTLLVCSLSLLGDLFESWLKRRANIKDSGNILPGHGGFLDRFDGILFAVFLFYFFKDHLITLFAF